jgi:hypothetical protein
MERTWLQAWTRRPEAINLCMPEATKPKANRSFISTEKGFIMNEKLELEMDLQVVELGDAKEVTMGTPDANNSEDNPQQSERV